MKWISRMDSILVELINIQTLKVRNKKTSDQLKWLTLSAMFSAHPTIFVLQKEENLHTNEWSGKIGSETQFYLHLYLLLSCVSRCVQEHKMWRAILRRKERTELCVNIQVSWPRRLSSFLWSPEAHEKGRRRHRKTRNHQSVEKFFSL